MSPDLNIGCNIPVDRLSGYSPENILLNKRVKCGNKTSFAINKKKKIITSVQPDEADEMVDLDADATVQSGNQIRRRMLLSPKVGQRVSN